MARETTRRRRGARDTSSYTEPDESYEDDNEPDEDEKPARRRHRSRDDEDEKPARGRRSSRHDDDDDDEDQDDDKKSRGRRSSKAPTGTHGAGWGAYGRNKSQTSSFPQELKTSDEAVLIKFLDAEPFTSYLQHWVDEVGPGERKSYTCLGDDCPLCDIGSKKSTRTCFNVIEWTDPDQPTVKVWTVSSTVADQLYNLSSDKKTSPLDRVDIYWSVSRTGGGKRGSRTTWTILPVKARDLQDDWDIEPLTEDEIDEFANKAYTDEDVVRYDSKTALRQLINALED